MRKSDYPMPAACTPAPAQTVGPRSDLTEMERIAMSIDQFKRWFWEGKNFGNLWVFDEKSGLWRPDGRQTLRNMYGSVYAEKCCDEKGRKAQYNRALGELESYFLSLQTDREQHLPDSPLHLIPFQNGVYDLNKNCMIKYDPEHYFTSKLPWNFNENATCPWFMQLFGEWVSNPQELIDLMGLCLYRAMPLQKLFMILGSGANGKTMFLQILQRTLGGENVGTVPLHELGERFSEIELYRKHANIVDELRPDSIRDTGTIKRFTGESQICADVKHRAKVIFTSYATQIFAMNTLPPTDDKSDAFYRRVHLIDFPNAITPEKQDRTLSQKLAAETDNYEGFILLAIRALQAARVNNWVFAGIKPQSIETVKMQYSNRSDSVDFILTEFCHLQEGERIPATTLLMHVNRMRRVIGLMPVRPSFVRQRMQTAGIDSERVHVAGTGDYQACWMDVRLDTRRIEAWYESHDATNDTVISPETRDFFEALSPLELAILDTIYAGWSNPARIAQMTECSDMVFRMSILDFIKVGFISGDASGPLPVSDRARRAQIEALLMEGKNE